MKKALLTLFCSLIPGAAIGSDSNSLNSDPLGESIYQGTFKTLRGEPVAMEEFKGRVALIVNTASKCGFTEQYHGLEKLYQRYKDRGFVVLGFPSNDFGKQEPGSNEEIGQFCAINYGVSFPMFEKNSVTGPDKQPLYKSLTEKSHENFRGNPGWNFVKFVVDKKGFVRGRFNSLTRPGSKKISKLIESLLEQD